MPCSYSVTSEDTADFISTYSALPEQLSAMTGIECIDFVSRQFAVLHIPMDDLERPMNFSYYTYSAIPEALFPPGHRQHGGLRDPSRLPDPRLREPGPGRPHRLRGHWHRLSESPVPEGRREFQDPGDLGPDSGNRRPGSCNRLPALYGTSIPERRSTRRWRPRIPWPWSRLRTKTATAPFWRLWQPEERIRTRILPEPPQGLPLPW